MTRLRKNQFLQVRVSSRQKAALRRLARTAGVDVSRYVLDRVLPGSALELQLLLNRLARTWEPQPVLAEIADVLVALPPAEFGSAVQTLVVEALDEYHQALVAAMVEQAAALKRVEPPPWAGRIGPLRQPYFASDLPSVRLHLLTASPPPYRGRNIFVDASITDRV